MAVQLLHLPSRPSSDASHDTCDGPARQETDARSSNASASEGAPLLHALIGYESGQLALFCFSPTAAFEIAEPSDHLGTYHRPREKKVVDENEGWDLVWAEKGHRDASTAPLLSLPLSPPY